MHQQHIILESSPAFIVLCLLAGLAFAVVLYRKSQSWGKIINRILFGLRFTLVFLLTFFLLGPMVKQIRNYIENPLIVVLKDNSLSIKSAVDSLHLKSVNEGLSNALASLSGYETVTVALKGDDNNITYQADQSDIHGALKRISAQFEGRSIAHVVLMSDGIYNSGLSPLYGIYPFPIHTLGIGDTIEHVDMYIKNITYNKLAYQGNRFPIRAEIVHNGFENRDIHVRLLYRGKLMDRKTLNTGKQRYLTIDFEPLADEQGIQKFDIEIEPLPGDLNKSNNRASAFVEIVAGKKNVLIISPSPHPDIKAMRLALEKNTNYNVLLHIPGVMEQPRNNLVPGFADLVVFYQSPDLRGRTRELFQGMANGKTPFLLVLGQQSDLPMLSRSFPPVKFESNPSDFDEVVPEINPAFIGFSLTAETIMQLSGYPPLSVPFGKVLLPPTTQPLLFQKIGNVPTEKPLIAVDLMDAKKTGIVYGEGFWRWRLNEFNQSQSTEAFDELFGKLVQYLSSTEDKRRFKSYPIKREFSETETVLFDSQVYNELYEPIYGHGIDIELTDENGQKKSFRYTTSAGNAQYAVGGLKEGVYRYKASTLLDGKAQTAHGEFAITARQAELLNLTADFGLLRKLSSMTGGHFYNSNDVNKISLDLSAITAKSVLHSEETFNALINLKWVFWLLLALISTEWFLRKYHGSY